MCPPRLLHIYLDEDINIYTYIYVCREHNQTDAALACPSARLDAGAMLPMEHMRDIMMLIALGGEVT